MVERTQTRLSAAEFEALPEQDTPIELIEGVLVVRGVPTINHQRVVLNLATKLREIAKDGEVFVAPVSVKLNEANYYQPDVLWVSAANNQCVVRDDGINGPPDLVVEVISPGTAANDRGVKFRSYQAAGVREYWIVEPAQELAFIEVWVLDAERYVQQGLYHAGETLESPVLGASLALDGVFPASQADTPDE